MTVQLHTYPTFAAAQTAIAAAATIDYSVVQDAASRLVADLDVIETQDNGDLFVMYDGEILPADGQRLGAMFGDRKIQNSMIFVKRHRRLRVEIAERDALEQRILATRAAIVAAVGPRMAYRDGSYFLDGVHFYGISISEEHSTVHRFKTRSNGRVRVAVGSYGNKASFPQRKDGTHNYAEIARIILQCGDALIAQRAAEARTKIAAPVVVAARAELKFISTYAVTPSSIAALPAHVKFTIDRNLTPAQLLALDEVLAGWDATTR